MGERMGERMGDVASLPYEVAGGFDEAVAADGTVRESWAAVSRALGLILPAELAERQRRIDRLLDAEGAGHLVHDLAVGRPRDGVGPEADSIPWRLDPIPMVVSAGDFEHLASAATQRMRVIEAMLCDIYGPRDLVRSGAIPASTLFGLRAMRTSAATRNQRRWLVHYALDVVRTASGEWRVVQDLTDAPPGLGYALLNRSVMARLSADVLRSTKVAPITAAATALRLALTSSAPRSIDSPRTVVLTTGPSHATYVEHSHLALQMGFHLAEGGDVVVRSNRLWLRALEALEPVDVVYRRIEDVALDPLEIDNMGRNGVPAVTWAAQHGGVTLANGFGSSVAEAPALASCFPAVADALLGETLRLADLDEGAELATTPLYSPSATTPMRPASAVVRLHAIAGDEGITVMPGGVGRVLAPGDSPRESTLKLVKDVWVLGAGRQQRLPLRVTPPPQVDFRGSVTRRAAEALYWMGRSAERAEFAARTVRLLGQQVDQDPALTSFTDAGGWSDGALGLLRAARGPAWSDRAGEEMVNLPLATLFGNELAATQASAATSIGTVVHEATSVREYLSTAMGRLLGRLARLREDLLSTSAGMEELDLVLVDLAALAGLAMESTVRGPSWRFLDIGRRLERALAVLGSIEAALGVACDPTMLQPLAESVLSVNESLVAYRRRHRSDVDLTAVLDLLVHDDTNPRSVSFQLDRLREHLASLSWSEGGDLVHRAGLGALTTVDSAVASGRRISIDALVLAIRGPLIELASGITARWFAVPVNPVVVGSSSESSRQ